MRVDQAQLTGRDTETLVLWGGGQSAKPPALCGLASSGPGQALSCCDPSPSWPWGRLGVWGGWAYGVMSPVSQQDPSLSTPPPQLQCGWTPGQGAEPEEGAVPEPRSTDAAWTVGSSCS